jgi:hypothetical protein
MSKKGTNTNDLILELGTIIEQIQVLKRGLKEHPTEEIFIKGIDFMKQEAELIMKELTIRRTN